ncbi:hypothetical protein [Streptomyces sp. S.PNR 29]|nr:hypothetical protein [Streptomyces sp. S.PNR 29]MDN0193974.1 hypothetical protein [Streptomyces sp. S.PNR 29]
MGKTQSSPEGKGKVREIAGRFAIALGARALWAVVERLLGQHIEG